jgi:hypothetical protein
MSRRAASFTQADIARALRAAEQTTPGKLRLRVAREGEIIIEPAGLAEPEVAFSESVSSGSVKPLREFRL